MKIPSHEKWERVYFVKDNMLYIWELVEDIYAESYLVHIKYKWYSWGDYYWTFSKLNVFNNKLNIKNQLRRYFIEKEKKNLRDKTIEKQNINWKLRSINECIEDIESKINKISKRNNFKPINSRSMNDNIY